MKYKFIANLFIANKLFPFLQYVGNCNSRTNILLTLLVGTVILLLKNIFQVIKSYLLYGNRNCSVSISLSKKPQFLRYLNSSTISIFRRDREDHVAAETKRSGKRWYVLHINLSSPTICRGVCFVWNFVSNHWGKK